MADLVFVIDGNEFPFPEMETFNMAERRVMFELSGIVEEDFVREPDETDEEHDARVSRMARHPGFLEALMHIAYARGNPDLKRQKVQAVVDSTNFQEAIQKWGDKEDDDASHPASASTSGPSGSSSTRSPGSDGSSGAALTASSDERDATPGSTGHTRSDTSPTSDRRLSAA